MVRIANNTLVERAGGLLVFDPVSDDALLEIKLVKRLGKPVCYFEIVESKRIMEIGKTDVRFEPGAEDNHTLL
jgi:hypothetical protein